MVDILYFIIAILFLNYFGRRIIRFITGMVINSDSTNYPLFNRLGIAALKTSISIDSEKVTKLYFRINKRLEHEAKEKEIVWNKDFNEELKREFRYYLSEEADLVCNQIRLNLQIESNIAVLNGKKISEVEAEYSKKVPFLRSELESRLIKAWESDKYHSSAWTKQYGRYRKEHE